MLNVRDRSARRPLHEARQPENDGREGDQEDDPHDIGKAEGQHAAIDGAQGHAGRNAFHDEKVEAEGRRDHAGLDADHRDGEGNRGHPLLRRQSGKAIGRQSAIGDTHLGRQSGTPTSTEGNRGHPLLGRQSGIPTSGKAIGAIGDTHFWEGNRGHPLLGRQSGTPTSGKAIGDTHFWEGNRGHPLLGRQSGTPTSVLCNSETKDAAVSRLHWIECAHGCNLYSRPPE